MVVQEALEFPRNADKFPPIFWEETGEEPNHTEAVSCHTWLAFLIVDGKWTSLYSSFVCKQALAQLVVRRTQPPAITNVVELQEETKSLKWVLLSPSVEPHKQWKGQADCHNYIATQPLDLAIWKSALHKSNRSMIICLLITTPSFYKNLGSKTSLSSLHN